MTEPRAAADNCEHHYATRILGGHPLQVRACTLCHTPDWADLDEQASALWRKGWAAGHAAASGPAATEATEPERCCGKPAGAICVHDVSAPAESPLRDQIADAIGRIPLVLPIEHRRKAADQVLAVIQPGAGITATLARMSEAGVQRVIDLYERWVKAGPPPLGTSMSRWWDARLVELHHAILPPKAQLQTPDELREHAETDDLTIHPPTDHTTEQPCTAESSPQKSPAPSPPEATPTP